MKNLLIVFSTLLIAACASAPDRAGDGLTFFHLNDTYRIGSVQDGTAGGFGRVATKVRAAKAAGRDVRILHGGDFLYPSLESQIWHGMQIVDAFNFLDALAPMYVVAGNHEFDPRQASRLVDAVSASDFDWLGDNYDFITGNEAVDSALRDAFVFEHGERRIGVFALTLHETDGGNARDYLAIDPDYTAVAERTIRELERQGADLVIGVTHLHIWQDEEIAELRARHPKFLFIVGGHEHEPEFRPLTASSASIMKGASDAREIWRIDIGFGGNGLPFIDDARLLELDESVAVDAEYDELRNKWRTRLLEKFPFLTAKVGEAAEPLDAREVTIRNEESGWGNFIVDQMRGAFGDPPADLAFINSGTIRIDDYIAGDILFEDIGRTFGFSSYLRYVTLTGAEFRDVLEAGYRGEGPSKGYFPQVSGFRVCVDRSRPEGQRIVSLELADGNRWREIEDDREYLVVVPDYLYRGGDGYSFPPDADASRPGSELKYLVLDAIMAAQAEGQAIGEAADPDDPRIVILETPEDRCPADGE